MTTHRIDLIDEDNAGSILLALFKQIANARCAYADKHFNEVGTRNREEGNIRFAGDGARKQSLARSWRAHHQHAFGNPSAKFLKLLRLLKKFNNLLEFFLGFLDARNILKRHPLLLIV